MSEKISCPFCKGYALNFENAVDEVVTWTDHDEGVITVRHIMCENPDCQGSKGFDADINFTVAYCSEYTL